jgi:hypothetical protein
MILVEDASNNYEASTLRTISSKYNRILQIAPIILNLQKYTYWRVRYHNQLHAN